MESSIAEFLTRWCASEQLPTSRWVVIFCGEHVASNALRCLLLRGEAPCRTSQLQPGSAKKYMAYLLGLLAMIKCSICSYQCDN
jgi:hypothetical protein